MPRPADVPVLEVGGPPPPSQPTVNMCSMGGSPSTLAAPVCFAVEQPVVARLVAFHARQVKKMPGEKLPPHALQNIVNVIFLRQGIPTSGTFVLLLLGGILNGSTVYVLSTIIIFVLYSSYCLLQYELLRARATELRCRTLRILADVSQRWSQRIEAASSQGQVALASSLVIDAEQAARQTAPHASEHFDLHSAPTTVVLRSGNNSFVMSDSIFGHPLSDGGGGRSGLNGVVGGYQPWMEVDAALLACRSLRLVATRFQGQFALVPKCLLPRGAQRYDVHDLRWETFREGHGDICKLLDSLRLILDRDAVMLRPLANLARPPRLPNLRIAALLEEEVETTDESDGERETRSVIGGRSTTSMPQRMEYFVMRIMTLIWGVCLVLLALVGLLRYALSDPGHRSIGYECLIQPVVVVLGFLPLNAFLVNRFLYLVNNALVHTYAAFLTRRYASAYGTAITEAALPQPPMGQLLRTAWNVLRHPGQRADLPVYLARSTVETLGTVTVVVELDSSGVLTDMVPLPVAVLVIKENPGVDESSSSSDEDERLFLTQKSLEATKQRKRDMRMQVRRKRFQEERFTQLKFTPSPDPNIAIAFAEPAEQQQHASSINPLCLCALLHAHAPWPSEPSDWCEGIHFVDRTRSWAQTVLWVAKASGFHDSALQGFEILARLFSVKTTQGVEVDAIGSRYPDQACALVCRDVQRQIHVFVLGTTKAVVDACSSYWTGKETEEFDDHEKAEVRFFAEKQWGAAQGMEAVGMSHRVLPDRYQRFVATLSEERRTLGRPAERFFVNDVLVNSTQTATEASQRGMESPNAIARKGSAELLDDSLLLLDVCGLRKAPVPRLRKVLSNGDMPQFHGGPLEADSTLSNDTFLTFMMSTSHTLLGLIALRDAIRPHVQNAIQALDDAGIRFMHFGSGTEQRTKAFGDRIGLETDWNCCISLKAESVALDPHSIRAQLPFGIPSIRKHIIYVDPIPLQVNLFSHSRGVSTRSMVSVLQDNHEVVLALGALTNHCNTRSFVQADYSIGVLPSREGPSFEKQEALCATSGRRLVDPMASPTYPAATQTGGSPQASFIGRSPTQSPEAAPMATHRCTQVLKNVSDLLGTACTLDVGRCPNILPVTVRLVRECRVLLAASSNCGEFILHANSYLVALNMATVVIGLPMFLSTWSILFLLNAVIPILGMGCNYSMFSASDAMQVKQAKQNFDTRFDMMRHALVVFALRYMPSVVAGVLYPVLLVLTWCDGDDGATRSRLNPWSISTEAATTGTPEGACLSDVRSMTFFAVVLWLTAHSLTQLSRHQSIGLVTETIRRGHTGRLRFNVLQARDWMKAAAGATVLSVLFHFLCEHNPRDFSNRLTTGVVVLFLIAFLFPGILFALDIPIKHWRAKRYSDMQKFRTLSYGTRLGMHSPRGDYEPSEGDDGSDGGDGHQMEAHHSGDHAAAADDEGHGSGEPGGHGVDALPSSHSKAAVHTLSFQRRIEEFLFRWCSVSHGSLELHCVCCDHEGGHPAQYCS